MISRIAFLTVFTCCSLAASSQQYCARTMIFFDFGKYNLKKAEQKKLDSLANAIGEGNYLMELSGHCDSVNTEEFNMKLSQQRNNEVEKYLKKKAKKAILTIKEFPRGEDRPMVPNSSDENMAKNRRVDVYILVVDDNKLSFNGSGKESIQIPADFSGESCSICEELKIRFLHNDQEARSANIPLKSSTGRELTTAGMAQFSFECPEKMTSCLPIKITMPASSALRFECLSHWNLKPNGNWEAGNVKLQADRSSNSIVFTDGCYKLGGWVGFNKPMVDLCKHQINFPQDAQVLKSKVTSQDSSFFTEQAQMPLTLECGSNNSMFSWATADGMNYYLRGSFRALATKTENTGNCDTLFTYDLTKDKYSQIPVSDTTMFVKFKGFDNLRNPGFYINELDLLLPLTNVKKTTYTANYLNYDHTLRFEDDKVYSVKYTDVKTKYKSGKKKLKVTVKKKKLLDVTVEAS